MQIGLLLTLELDETSPPPPLFLCTMLHLKLSFQDPWWEEYCKMSTSTIKMMIQTEAGTNEQLKMHLINKWVVSNAFESIPSGVYDLLKCIDLKELSDNQIKSITDQVQSILIKVILFVRHT